MSKQHSFNIVSEVDIQEVRNAVHQAEQEIRTRFDFKGSLATIALEEEDLTINAENDFKVKSVVEIVQAKLVKRNVPLKAFQFGKIEPAAGGTAKQKAVIVQGIDQDRARKINKFIKDMKVKANSQIEGDAVRVMSADIDTLQAIITAIKAEDFGIPLQFINYR